MPKLAGHIGQRQPSGIVEGGGVRKGHPSKGSAPGELKPSSPMGMPRGETAFSGPGPDPYCGIVLERLLWIAGIVLGLWLLSWVVMVLLARRLPPGLLRDVAEFLPACVTTARRLRRDPAVPRRAKIALLVAVAWVISPIDLLPEFLPVIGPLDDVVAVVLLLRYAARAIPRETLLAAWPADPRLLLRLLDGSKVSADRPPAS
jgi:uncharacterized membrane protein YkvA (DUF1232 family)